MVGHAGGGTSGGSRVITSNTCTFCCSNCNLPVRTPAKLFCGAQPTWGQTLGWHIRIRALTGKAGVSRDFLWEWPISCREMREALVPSPRSGRIREDERRRDDNEEDNSRERSRARYGDRSGYRRWTKRAPSADVLLLRLQVQRET